MQNENAGKTVERIAESYNNSTPHEGLGSAIFMDGYTHYLSPEDLLRLPTEKK